MAAWFSRTRSEHQVISALIKYQPPAELVDSGLRDDGLKTLLAKCWNKDPSARPSASKCQLYLPIPGGSEAQLPGTRVSLSSAAQLVANSNFPQPRPSTAVDSPFGSEEPWDTLSGVDSTLGTSGNVRQHGPVLHLFPTLRVDEESLAKSAWNPTSLGNDPTFGTSGGARQESVFAQVLEPLEPGYPLLSGKDIHGTSSRGVSTVKSIVKPFTCPICK
ncbi:hypothetical protein M407DRAFT_31486 [Tulasnella calospora MUT 4182]|uniref:Protein kinase domain-containing protein n=1 Tax=Tulasnella calospora MUT 4182 TaxID=1051891 RepID=A0A0C3Q6D7_9AGAM|nr:hypothetical protein M407DRAFT_31486 [Tulasnella calospora MUT 4182]